MVEMVHFDAGAAISITELMIFFPLAALECLGAMARERCACVCEEEHVRAEEEEEVEEERIK